MTERHDLSWIEFGKALAIVAVVGAGAATLYVWSGLYNVSAQRQHFDVTTWLLGQVRRQSVRTQSNTVQTPPADLDSEDMVLLGAVHFELSCAACHGAPGRMTTPIGTAMLPTPPPLNDVTASWSPQELHWIVRNGQKYTGMPGWISYERDDEVWPVVAFLRRLPDMSPAEYERLSGYGSPETPRMSAELGADATVDVCARCHGVPGEVSRSNRVPTLSGMSEAYLVRALEEYREGRRQSGFMQLAAAKLRDEDIVRLAKVYAEALPPTPAAIADSELADRGGEIVAGGLAAQKVPPCFSCHSGLNPQFPALFGQSASYISQQLHVFREGTRDLSPYGAIMTKVAAGLSDTDIAAVSAYLGVPVGQDEGAPP